MYDSKGSTLMLGVISVQFIIHKKIKAVNEKEIRLHPKNKDVARYLIGGIIFGLGWALAGACPGPMSVLLGAGYTSILIVVFGALLGTFICGMVKDKLPIRN